MLHYEACRFDEVLKSMSEIEPTLNADEEKARMRWLKGAALQKLDKLNEAKVFNYNLSSTLFVSDKNLFRPTSKMLLLWKRLLLERTLAL